MINLVVAIIVDAMSIIKEEEIEKIEEVKDSGEELKIEIKSLQKEIQDLKQLIIKDNSLGN